MFLEHIYAEKKIKVNFIDDLKRAFDVPEVSDFEVDGVYATHDGAHAHSNGHAFEAGVDLPEESCLLGKAVGDDGTLGPSIHKCLKLIVIHCCIDEQHRRRNKRLRQMELGVFPGITLLIYKFLSIFS